MPPGGESDGRTVVLALGRPCLSGVELSVGNSRVRVSSRPPSGPLVSEVALL